VFKRSLATVVLGLIVSALWTLSPAHADRFAYVVNSYPGDETLSKINLTTGEVSNDILWLGESPNQIVVQGDSAYVVNSLDHDIQIIDLTTETTVGYINIGEPRNPFHMAFVNRRYAYVTNLVTSSISKVDVATQAVVAEYGVGLAPEGLIPVGGKLYICCTGFQWPKYKQLTGEDWTFDPTHRANEIEAYSYVTGQVYVFDLQSQAVTDSIAVGMNPQYLDVDPEGELNVVCTGDFWSVFGRIYRIDTAGNAVVDSIGTGGSPGVISIGSDGIGYLAAGGWYPDPGMIYTFDSHADTMIRGSTNPVTTDSGVMSVTALFPSQVLSCNYQGDDMTRFNSSGFLLDSYLLGNGPVSAAVYSPVTQYPVLGKEGLILLVLLLGLAGSFILKKRRCVRAT
jgi:YVTN family beta-propeller protein